MHQIIRGIFRNRKFSSCLGLLAGLTPLAAAEFDVRNEAEFKKCVAGEARVEKLAGDMGFVEGPVWFNGFLVFSDIPNNELKKWTKAGGLTTFRKPSQNANGNTTDADGRLEDGLQSHRPGRPGECGNHLSGTAGAQGRQGLTAR